MEICPKCNSTLRIGKSFYSYENDDTPDKQTVGYINLPMLCVNGECSNYAGKDLSNPKTVVETIKNKLN